MLTLAGERGWIPMSINIVPPRVLKPHWADRGRRRRHGRPRRPTAAIWRIARDVYVGRDDGAGAPAGARRGAGARLARLLPARCVTKRRGLDVPSIDPAMPDDGGHARVPGRQHLDRRRCRRGGRRKLRRLYEDVGGFGTLLVIGHEWQPREPGRAPCACSSTRCSRACERPGGAHDDPPARRRGHARRRDRHAGPRRRPGRLRAQPGPDGRLARRHARAPPRPRQDPQVPGRRAPPDRAGRGRVVLPEGERGRGDGLRRRPERPRVERGGRRARRSPA